MIDDADANLDLNTATEYLCDGDQDGQGDERLCVRGLCSSSMQPLVPIVMTSTLWLIQVVQEYCNGLDDDCDGQKMKALKMPLIITMADSDGHGAYEYQ